MTVLALTVKIRKSQDFLAPISGSPGDQIFSLTFRNSTSIRVILEGDLGKIVSLSWLTSLS